MSRQRETELNVLLIDNQQRLFSCSRLLPELRRNLLLDQVSCMAAPDSLSGLQLCQAFEIDMVLLAICQAEMLRTMVHVMERDHPVMVILVVGENNDRAPVEGIIHEAGCRWIGMRPGGERPPIEEIARQVRLLKQEKMNIAKELSLDVGSSGSRVLIRLNATRICH